MPEPKHEHEGEDAVVFQPGDPRPKFAGDWAKATGYERQAHMTLIAKWKQAQPDKGEGSARSGSANAQSRTVEPGEEPERHADDLRALQHIIDSAPILSDRTRAIEAKQRILGKVEAEEREREHGPLVDLRAALDTLPAHERVGALASLLRVEG